MAGEVQQEEPSGIALPMLVVLGALSAIPPLSFDMYLPALPQIAGVARARLDRLASPGTRRPARCSTWRPPGGVIE